MDSKKEYPHKATSWLKRLQEKTRPNHTLDAAIRFCSMEVAISKLEFVTP